MPWPRRRSRARSTAGVLPACVATVTAAGCSSSPPPVPWPTSSQAAQSRASDAPALLIQCMLNQGTLGRSDAIFSGPPACLHDGNILIMPSTAARFAAWYQANHAITVAGQDLTAWTAWAAAHDELPPQVCGTSVSASARQRQVFGKDPAAGDPWGR